MTQPAPPHELDVEIVISQFEEIQILEQLSDSYINTSDMSYSERCFLTSLILRHKPIKVLEIGVAAGSSSVIILNAIKNVEGAYLYSIDKLTKWYRDKEKDCGFIVENYPDLRTKYKLYTGGFALDFIEEIGGIDFCLIDTMHINPGEILVFLMVFPFLNDDAIVIFHDTNLHTWRYPYELETNPNYS